MLRQKRLVAGVRALTLGCFCTVMFVLVQHDGLWRSTVTAAGENSGNGAAPERSEEPQPGAALASAVQAQVFTVDTTIANGDTTYDGLDIVVRGCTVTVNGAHSFKSLTVERNAENQPGVVTHTPEFFNGTIYGMKLSLEGDVAIQGSDGGLAASRISADGCGQAGGNGAGAGESCCNSGGAGGGGYGGSGGSGNTSHGGASYGSPVAPSALGSGGGTIEGNPPGGRGGGAVRLSVGGTLQVDGQITANGSIGSRGGSGNDNYSGGGSGGSIWVSARQLVGNGFQNS